MKSHKTVKIETLLAQGNAYLASAHSSPESRVGAYVLLEGALHAAKRYRGWGLLEIPGQQFFDESSQKWVISDESRRFYY
jgi:hypothetical protein